MPALKSHDNCLAGWRKWGGEGWRRGGDVATPHDLVEERVGSGRPEREGGAVAEREGGGHTERVERGAVEEREGWGREGRVRATWWKDLRVDLLRGLRKAAVMRDGPIPQRRSTYRLAAALSGVVATGCAARTLPPPEVPESRLAGESPPLPPDVAGFGRVVLEVDEGTAEVSEVVANGREARDDQGAPAAVGREPAHPLCTTPCVVTLLRGEHTLRFRSLVDAENASLGTVAALAWPTAYRHALGIDAPRAGARVAGWIATSVGITAALLGLLAGVLPRATDSSHEAANIATWGLSLGGVAALGVGVGLLVGLPATSQPGSGVQFPLSPSTTALR